MITHGNVCDFSFYVTEFDAKNNYTEVGTPATKLSLEQAKEEFAKRCSESPISVNTMLGVEYTTDRKNLEPMGMGAADLLQRVNGVLRLSEDYKLSQLLSQERLISVNAISILEREAARLQRISDNATAKCAKLISDKIPEINGDIQRNRSFMQELADNFGIDRCRAVLANELLGNSDEKISSEISEYLEDAFDGKYDKRFAVFANVGQLEELAAAAKYVEGLTETEGKLFRSGLVYGADRSQIRDKSALVKSEIERHNDLEDRGLAAEDQLDL